MITVHFKFNIGDVVRVVPLDVEARVDAVMSCITGHKFSVVYWCNGERKETWVYEWELK